MSKLLRGVFLLTVSNAIFLASGYIVQVLLGRFLSPAEYGLLGVLIYIVNIINTIFASGFLEGVSRTISQKPNTAYTVLRQGIKIEAIISGGLGLLYFLGSPLIAHILNAPGATLAIAFSALQVPLYGIRTVYIGFLNGLKKFEGQALATIAAAVLKVVLVAIFIFMGYGIIHILIAYFIAALSSLIVGQFYVKGQKDKTEPVDNKKLFHLALILSIYAAVFPLLGNIDLLAVKSLIHDPAVAGYYNAGTTLARFPQFLFGSLGAALLPTVAAYFHEKKLDEARKTIGDILRYGIIIMAPIAVLSIMTSSELIRFVYTPEYITAAGVFNILIVALSLLALVQILFTTLISVNAEKSVLYITFGVIATDIVLVYALTKVYGMMGAAISTLVVTIMTLIVCTKLLLKKIQTLHFKKMSFIKISVSLVLLALLGSFIQSSITIHGIQLVAFYAVMMIFYFAVLIFIKEITTTELQYFKKIFKKRI